MNLPLKDSRHIAPGGTMPHTRRGRVLPLGLILLVALAAGRSAAAQAGRPSGPPGAERHRLSLAELRKVMPALQSAGQETCERRQEKRDPFAMTLAEMAGFLERCEPIRAAITRRGVSSREAATVLGAFMYAGRRITEEESALALGHQAAPLPAGPLKDNVALIRQHEAELRRLTRPQSSGAGR